MNSDTIKLWDPLVRLFHWSLVLIFISNYFINDKGGLWHQWLGYTAVTWLIIRFIWGFVGSNAARWADFFPTPSRLWEHLHALVTGRVYHRMGHTPLGALVMILMMLCVLGLGTTGFMMMEVQRFEFSLWLEDLHAILADTLLALVILHISAAIFESWRMKENLPLSMITGKRRRRE